MRFSQEKVKDLARQIVAMMEDHPKISLEDSTTSLAVEVGSVILDDLREEDDIDAEVDDLLRQHSGDIQSQDMDVESLRLKFRQQIARDRGFVL
jgi:hypothetical protein